MARIEHIASGRAYTVGVRVLVGRAGHATLRLDGKRVSGEHAVIAFDGQGWGVRDLGSRNGTTLDGRAVKPGQTVSFEAGSTLAFAGDAWRVVHDGPPGPAARADDGRVFGEDGLLALPDLRDPQVSVFATRGGRWLAEVDGTPRYVVDGDTVEIDDQTWTLELPAVVGGAVVAATVGTAIEDQTSLDALVELRVAPSLDEESAKVTLVFAGGPLEVPSRASHLVLVHLARERVADAANGLPPSEQGWVYAEVVGEALDMDPQRLNVEVYRARRQLTKLGVQGAAELFERRTQTRQIRLGVDRVVVIEPGTA